MLGAEFIALSAVLGVKDTRDATFAPGRRSRNPVATRLARSSPLLQQGQQDAFLPSAGPVIHRRHHENCVRVHRLLSAPRYTCWSRCRDELGALDRSRERSAPAWRSKPLPAKRSLADGDGRRLINMVEATAGGAPDARRRSTSHSSRRRSPGAAPFRQVARRSTTRPA
jgi:hypothetical protein